MRIISNRFYGTLGNDKLNRISETDSHPFLGCKCLPSNSIVNQ